MRITASLIPIAVIVVAACGTTASPAAPTTAIAEAAASVSAQPAVAGHQATTFNFCPTTPAFSARVGLVVTATSDVAVLVQEITYRFVDSQGAPMPQVTLAAPVMTTQFGSALVNARNSRTFPLDVGMGCGAQHTGVVHVTAVIVDTNGRTCTRQLNVDVR
jgi:hypothetical protein